MNLNTATEADLDELPGVGPVTAKAILSWRDRNGRFSSVDQLAEVDLTGVPSYAELVRRVEAAGFVTRRRSRTVFSELAGLIADGTFTPHISASFPFPRAADAVAAVENGHALGKTVVRI